MNIKKIFPTLHSQEEYDAILSRYSQYVIRNNDTECWGWTAYIRADGHGEFKLLPYEPAFKAHRVSYWLHTLEPDFGQINHLCNQPWCQNYNHYDTEGGQPANIKQAYACGQMSQPKGDKSPVAVHSWNKIREIRRLRREDPRYWSAPKLGIKFGMNQGYIWLIINNKIWKE